MDQDDGGNRCGHSLLRPRAGFARPAHRPVPALLQQEKEVVCVRVRVRAFVCVCVHVLCLHVRVSVRV